MGASGGGAGTGASGGGAGTGDGGGGVAGAAWRETLAGELGAGSPGTPTITLQPGERRVSPLMRLARRVRAMSTASWSTDQRCPVRVTVLTARSVSSTARTSLARPFLKISQSARSEPADTRSTNNSRKSRFMCLVRQTGKARFLSKANVMKGFRKVNQGWRGFPSGGPAPAQDLYRVGPWCAGDPTSGMSARSSPSKVDDSVGRHRPECPLRV